MSRFLTAKTTNLSVCLLSASLLAVAFSSWMRPLPASAQAPATRRPVAGESKALLSALQDAFVNIADTAEPSVVTIEARAESTGTSNDNKAERRPRPMQDDDQDAPDPFRDLFKRRGQQDNTPRPSTGSGVIVRENGNTVYVLTNNHVVNQRTKFRVSLFDHATYPAELVGADLRADLAVLKFQVKSPLPAGTIAHLGDSDRVRVGQWAVAIGSPLGYESTLTVGVISAKGRALSGPVGPRSSNYVDLLQTDASINPGNSGGPLMDINGDVIGINVAIASSGASQGNIGIGFAIPSNTAKMVMEQLISTGKVVRGYLGVQCSTTNREICIELRDYLRCQNGGALVEDVDADTPAGKAGLKSGDVIVKFGERIVRSFTDLENAVAATRPGTAVPLEVVREGKPFRTSITPVERDEKAINERLQKSAGPDKEPAPRETRAQGTKMKYGLNVKTAEGAVKGVQVVGVADDSPAMEAGLGPEDIIVSVNNVQTPTVEALKKAMDAAAPSEALVMRVRTFGALRFVVVRP